MAKQHPSPTRPSTPAAPAPAAAPERPIKVRATRLGYFGNVRRRVGDVFTVPATQFSGRWMERAPADTPETLTTAPEALRREHADIVKQATPPQAPTPGDDDPTGDLNPLDV